MKIPIDWLKELVDIKKISTEDLAHKLTMSGLETTVVPEGIEVDILPNRGDCQSIIGVAHEVSAITGGKFKNKKYPLKEIAKKTSSVLKVEIKDKVACPRYMARVIEGVTITNSPEWLKNKLISIGMRPINNVVDITNYLLIELGQPMHAFDADKLESQKIIVRPAAPNEKITTIDGVERKLNKENLVIADSNRPIALAGVMGGANTEVSASTKTIILESAFFNPISISRTSKNQKLRTEASIRFEKSVDFDMVEHALDSAASMIAEFAGGKVIASKIDVKAKSIKSPILELRQDKIDKVLGLHIALSTAQKIFKRLGLKIVKSSAKSIKVQVPSARIGDIVREIDLIEEVARVNGYEHIPTTIAKILKKDFSVDIYSRVAKIKDILLGAGLNEVQTFSLVDPKDVEVDHVKVLNPLAPEESVMRTSMIPSILKVVSHNLRHQINDVRIFEIGKVYKPKGLERNILAGAICFEKADFFDIKGVIETLISEFSNHYEVISLKDDWYHPNKSASIVGLAKFGLLHAERAKAYDLSKEVYFFEVDVDALLNLKQNKVHKTLPKYPKVERDVAMFVPDNVSHADILRVIKESAGNLLEDVSLFDIYKNSRAYRMSFRDQKATLTDEIVNQKFNAVLSALESKLNVQIRK